MSAFGLDEYAQLEPVGVEIYTSAYRISGTTHTRSVRVADILNQLNATHLPVGHATISEHADPSVPIAAPSSMVAVDEILVMVAPGMAGEARSDMRIPKRAVRAQLAIPPLSIAGSIHVPTGGRPVDGFLNLHDRFVAMTDVTLTSAVYPQLERTAEVIAVRRDRAHFLLVADDENPDALLADVLDERTAEFWLGGGDDSR